MSFKRTKTGTERVAQKQREHKSSSTYIQDLQQAREPASYKYHSNPDLKGLARPQRRPAQPLNKLLKPDHMPNVRAELAEKRRVATQLATAK
jgi:hypothetical protein